MLTGKHEGVLTVPTGPAGQKRPADAIGLAVRVARIATGEEPEDDGKDKAAQALGKKGGAARAKAMTPERRAEIARWLRNGGGNSKHASILGGKSWDTCLLESASICRNIRAASMR